MKPKIEKKSLHKDLLVERKEQKKKKRRAFFCSWPSKQFFFSRGGKWKEGGGKIYGYDQRCVATTVFIDAIMLESVSIVG